MCDGPAPSNICKYFYVLFVQEIFVKWPPAHSLMVSFNFSHGRMQAPYHLSNLLRRRRWSRPHHVSHLPRSMRWPQRAQLYITEGDGNEIHH